MAGVNPKYDRGSKCARMWWSTFKAVDKGELGGARAPPNFLSHLYYSAITCVAIAMSILCRYGPGYHQRRILMSDKLRVVQAHDQLR